MARFGGGRVGESWESGGEPFCRVAFFFYGVGALYPREPWPTRPSTSTGGVASRQNDGG